jgi:hypothetical protein
MEAASRGIAAVLLRLPAARNLLAFSADSGVAFDF